MAKTTYKAVTRFKVPDGEDGFDWIERGEDVTAEDLGVSDEEFDGFVADKQVMEAEQFAATFPEVEEGFNQPQGTPSNLEEIEGTTLQAAGSEDTGKSGNAPVVPANPADPPVVEGAGTGEGFDKEGDMGDDSGKE
jgi:hypothetical protein